MTRSNKRRASPFFCGSDAGPLRRPRTGTSRNSTGGLRPYGRVDPRAAPERGGWLWTMPYRQAWRASALLMNALRLEVWI